MTTREKAIAICERAAVSKEDSDLHYAKIAEQLGYDVRFIDDGKWGDGEGPDMAAVEMAAEAWLRIDPEPLGITSIYDPRRDTAAADRLRAMPEKEPTA